MTCAKGRAKKMFTEARLSSKRPVKRGKNFKKKKKEERKVERVKTKGEKAVKREL